MDRSTEAWQPVTGAGSARTPVERLSLLAEIFLVHERLDEPSDLPGTAGLMINRHVWPGRTLSLPEPIGRDSPGEDESPTGAHLAYASNPRGDDGLGGELLGDEADTRTSHQREWDFLAGHVQAAYTRYRGGQMTRAEPSALSDWQKVEALARYAIQWKMRTADVYMSFHPVDVLFHSSYCTGAANVLHALALVAGFETRSIGLSNHSMVEIRVNGRWIWADNIWPDGGVTPTPFNYAQITEDPDAIVMLTAAQRRRYGSRTARWRSPWHFAGRCYWHFCWGAPWGERPRRCAPDGYGLAVPYDPSTATALYPEMKRHAFRVWREDAAAVCISEQGAWVRGRLALTPGRTFRKRFYVSDCPDNRLLAGVAKFRLSAPETTPPFRASLDGVDLSTGAPGVRFKQPTWDVPLPVDALTPGEHELTVTGLDRPVELFFYPDIVEPYHAPSLAEAIRIPDEAIDEEPVIDADDLDDLDEPLGLGI